MSQQKQPKDKKKLLLIIIPCVIILIGVVFFKNIFFKKKEETTTSALKPGVPDIKNENADSLSKTDLFKDMEDENNKKASDRAQFDETGNIVTDMSAHNLAGGGENLDARLKNEVSQPVYTDPVYNQTPVAPAVSTNRSRRGSTGGSQDENDYSNNGFTEQRDNGFNSIVLPNAIQKNQETGSYENYGIDQVVSVKAVSVTAQVNGTQKITNGGVIKIKLNEAISSAGVNIPAGTVVAGFARVTNTRLDVDIKSVNVNNKITFVRLKAFDMDGLEGLQISEKELKNISKEVINANMSGLENEIESKLAGYGGQAVGSIMRVFSGRRNQKSNSVTIPGGYQMILKD